MAHVMDNNLKLLLNGVHFDEDTNALCDFSIEEQNAAIEAQGIQPSASDFVPVLGKTVTYIVACILINENNEVLMIQEAKQSCAGKWYLPAGRMENGETIVDAAKREVLEETGLEISVTTLLGVECAGGSWYRFILTGEVLGGELKTPQKADRESLQAKWILDLNQLSLRANDILPIIELGRNFRNRNASDGVLWHKNILPTLKSHAKNFLRVVAVIKKRSNNKINVLVSEKNSYHFPTVEIHPARSIHATLRKFMVELFGAELPQHRPLGILSIEQSPSSTSNSVSTDGLCITLLVIFRPPLEEVSILKNKCVWHEVEKSIDDTLCAMLTSKNSTLALHVVR